jgi:hypothetical protein
MFGAPPAADAAVLCAAIAYLAASFAAAAAAVAPAAALHLHPCKHCQELDQLINAVITYNHVPYCALCNLVWHKAEAWTWPGTVQHAA